MKKLYFENFEKTPNFGRMVRTPKIFFRVLQIISRVLQVPIFRNNFHFGGKVFFLLNQKKPGLSNYWHLHKLYDWVFTSQNSKTLLGYSHVLVDSWSGLLGIGFIKDNTAKIGLLHECTKLLILLICSS